MTRESGPSDSGLVFQSVLGDQGGQALGSELLGNGWACLCFIVSTGTGICILGGGGGWLGNWSVYFLPGWDF